MAINQSNGIGIHAKANGSAVQPKDAEKQNGSIVTTTVIANKIAGSSCSDHFQNGILKEKSKKRVRI
jgi:hypothetical protein